MPIESLSTNDPDEKQLHYLGGNLSMAPSDKRRRDPVEYCLEVILREAPEESRLVKQLLYAMLSAYTHNPINMAINAPSGEGKNYIINKVADLFPKGDILALAGMSDKALFHRKGVLVVQNENGDYVPIADELSQIESEIENKQLEAGESTNKDFKKVTRTEIAALEERRKELYKNAKKLIDLSFKTLIFLDTPSITLLSALMPLLSHDKFEVEYEYVDTHEGIKTKSNVLRGWPAVIFAQAMDLSHYARYPEIQRRFITTNPKMSPEKYKAAVALTSKKFGLPDYVYQALVVSDGEKAIAREEICKLKDILIDLSTQSKAGKHNVFVPFSEMLTQILPSEKASDMTGANRFFTYIALLSQIRFNRRPKLLVRKQGNPVIQSIPLVLFEDMREAISLMEYSGSVRPYVLEWFEKVFLSAYAEKNEPDIEGEKAEKVRALTTKQLVDQTLKLQGKKLSSKQVFENYLTPLVNLNFIDKADSEIDKRANIYFPVIAVMQKSLFEINQTNNLSDDKRLNLSDSKLYPDELYITSKIDDVLQYSSENKILRLVDENGTERTSKEIAATYYNNHEQFFRAPAAEIDMIPDEVLKRQDSGAHGLRELEKPSN